MEKIAIIITVMVILSIINIAKAVEIDFYGSDIEISERGLIEKLTITLNSSEDIFSFPTRWQGKPTLQKVTSNNGEVNCSIVSESGKNRIDCSTKKLREGRNTINFEINIPTVIESSGEKNTLSVNYEFPFDTRSLSVSYKFPERAALSEDPPENSISPRNGDIKTDGKKMFIFWNKQDIEAGDILTFSASYTLPNQRESPINTLLIIPIIIVLGAFVWFVIKNKKTTKVAGETAAVSVLSSDEKILFDILKIHEGKANQKILVRESNFSKAKVSRLLKELKSRGVIDIEAISGRENRVVLKLGGSLDKQKKEIQEVPQKDPTTNNTES